MTKAALYQTLNDSVPGASAAKTPHQMMSDLAASTLWKTESLDPTAVTRWEHLFDECSRLNIKFDGIIASEVRYHRSILELLLESKNVKCCSFVHFVLKSGDYAFGRVLRTDSLLITKEDKFGRSHGFQRLPGNGHYVGEFLSRQRDGVEKMDLNLGRIYRGDFQKDLYHGYGQVTSKVKSSESYEGIFIEGGYFGNPKTRTVQRKNRLTKPLGVAFRQ